MARAAFVLDIRPDKVDDYIRAHEQVWPEMLEAIRGAGIRNYTIFIHGSQAFGYLESDDLGAAWQDLASTEVNERWQAAMAELLEARVSSEGPALLREIFRLD